MERGHRAARGLSRLPLTPSHDCKGDQEKHDSDGTDDVRHDGNQTRNIAGVGPDEADNRSHDEDGDHRSEPVENPSSSDDAEPTLTAAFRESKRRSPRVGALATPRSRDVSQPPRFDN